MPLEFFDTLVSGQGTWLHFQKYSLDSQNEPHLQRTPPWWTTPNTGHPEICWWQGQEWFQHPCPCAPIIHLSLHHQGRRTSPWWIFGQPYQDWHICENQHRYSTVYRPCDLHQFSLFLPSFHGFSVWQWQSPPDSLPTNSASIASHF